MQVVRARSARVLGAVMVAVSAVGLVTVSLAGLDVLARWAAPVALFGVLGHAAFWRPCVEISDAGVRVVNTLRTVDVPWDSLVEVEGRYGLRLVTSSGTVQAWGAQAPAGRARGGAPESVASAAVRRRWERRQALERYARTARPVRVGHREEPPVTYHLGVLVALVLLLTLSVAGLGFA